MEPKAANSHMIEIEYVAACLEERRNRGKALRTGRAGGAERLRG